MAYTHHVYIFSTCLATLLLLYFISCSLNETTTTRQKLPIRFQRLQISNKEDLSWLSLTRQKLPRIAIVMVIEPNTKLAFYKHAILSMRCYARIWKYEFQIVNSRLYWHECTQRDKFFRRHCIVAKILKSFDYVLFLDADMGVVNPKRRIEEYFDPTAEIIFYDRFYNWEVAAGAYLVRNTDWATDFLEDFANYEDRLPKSFHGTDNGALHAYLAEHIVGDKNRKGLDKCLFIYNRSRDYEDLFLYEACIRHLLGNGTNFGKIKILKKGTAWVRDNWITNSLWSPERDFMIHNWKTDQLRKYMKTPLPLVSRSSAEWYNPLAGSIELSKCQPGNTSWSYDQNLLRSREIIDKRLNDFAEDVEKKKAKYLRRLVPYRVFVKQ